MTQRLMKHIRKETVLMSVTPVRNIDELNKLEIGAVVDVNGLPRVYVGKCDYDEYVFASGKSDKDISVIVVSSNYSPESRMRQGILTTYRFNFTEEGRIEASSSDGHFRILRGLQNITELLKEKGLIR